jgi:SulP family sulfate permease
MSGDTGNPVARLFWLRSKDLFAGVAASFMSIAYGLSFSALIFAPPLTAWLAYGIAATFIASAVSAAIMASHSSLPFAIAGPDGATAAVTATLVTTVTERLIAVGPPDDLLAPIMIVVVLATALTGILLVVLGLVRAGIAIRFIPYPVIGGFLSATGWLMVSGAVRVITDHRLNFANLDKFLDALTLEKLAAATAILLALNLALRRARNPLVLPTVLLAGIVVAQLIFALTGTTLDQALSLGWTFKAPTAIGLATTWDLGDVKHFRWEILPSLSGDILAVMFVTTITMLLNTTGIELVTKREAQLGRELTTLGVANLASAALGGYVGCTSLSRTTLTYAAGGRGRICGLTVAAASALMLAVDPAFLAYVPRFVLGGLLLYLGVNLMYEWLVGAARRISRLEYASLLAIALIIVQWGFIAGVLIGVIIGCLTFAVSASRVNTIKFRFDGLEYRSTLDRGQDEIAILTRHGQEIQGMTLQSYLFFGSANRLYRQVKALLKETPECRFLLFDFRLVTGVDSSAMYSFTQIKQAVDDAGVKLILVNLSQDLAGSFRTQHIITDDVTVTSDFDRALETCERAVIKRYLPKRGEKPALRDWLTQALGSAEYADELVSHCKKLHFKKGDIIAEQGDEADCMHFIMKGRIAVIVHMRNRRTLRVRSLGFHTTIGEMGLISRQARSATIKAESDSVLYALSLDAYQRIARENPDLNRALLTYVIEVMADRLNFASKTMGVLRR